MGHKIAKIIGWTLFGIVMLVIAIPALLYIPAVQEFAKNIALEQVKKSTGMDISVERLRLRFPLKVELGGVSIVEASGDTMAVASMARVAVKPLPLLKARIVVEGAELENGRYRLGTPDSSLYLTAAIDRFDLSGSSLGFKDGVIDIGDAELEGGNVRLIMTADTTAAVPADSTASTPWHIAARNVGLKDVTYTMVMLPTIDSLGVELRRATLSDAMIDMATRRINGRALDVDLARATYLLPDSAYLKSHPAVAADTEAADTTDAGAMWTITASTLSLKGDSAVYAVRGAVPAPGLDMSFLQANNIAIEVDSFYNCGAMIRVPLKRLEATERCGVSLNASGVFAMDSTLMTAENFNIATGYSDIKLNAAMGMGDLTTAPGLPLRLDATASIALEDVRMAMPSLKPMLRDLPQGSPLKVVADINGSSSRLNVERLTASIYRFLDFKASGAVDNPFDFARLGGRVNFTADAIGLNRVKPTLLDAKLAKELNLPHTMVKGQVNYSPNLISGNLTATAAGGNIALKGRWNQRAEGYDADFTARDFPVDAFMPSLGVGLVDATVKASGQGYNPLSPAAKVNLELDLNSVEYLNETYRAIRLDATLAAGHANGHLRSLNPNADLDVDIDATLSDTACVWALNGEVNNLDLRAMKLSTTPMGGSLALESSGRYNPATNAIDATLTVGDLKWQLNDMMLATPAIDATFASTDSTVNFAMVNGDLSAMAMSSCGLDSLLAKLAGAGQVIDSAIVHKRVDVIKLQNSLPPIAANVTVGGQNNVACTFLKSADMGLRNATLNFANDSLLNLNAKVTGFTSGQTRLDTLSLSMVQHGRYLVYDAAMNNRPGTLDGFAHVKVNGFLADDKIALMMNQQNIKGEKGFVLGVSAQANDSILNMRFVPYKPTIGYKRWTLNRDNFITFNMTDYHLDANIEMSNDESSLRLFTAHSDSTAHTSIGNEDVILRLSNIKLQEWLAVSPFAPPMKGDIDADLRFRWNREQIAGNGTVDLNDFYYGRDRVGSFTVGLDVTNRAGGVMYANASLMVDSVKVITATGTLNDSTAREPFLLDFSMIKLPLRIANPFLPKDYAQLAGTLNGRLDITGSLAKPVFNGYLDFDSTVVKIPMAGTALNFSDSSIPVDSNVVKFNDFAITAANSNPLTVNGTVDMRNLADVAMDLALKARNMQLVNTNRARAGAQIYGKAFVDVDASVKGDMRFIDVDARLNVLAGTNVTYITESTDAVLASQGGGEMVRFVQFNDTTQVETADSVVANTLAMNLDANLIISQGSTINVDISGDAQNRISINGQGNLTYTMSPMNDGRLTGRYTINSGFARYSPPVVRQLDFTLEDGSYVAFTGDMLNPQLNITATEKIKANVTQSGQNSRLVDFFVTLAVSNTLQNMDVKFDLATDNDITVQNELAAMSPQQRANQAMNLLLYNTYTGPDTKASSNLSGNPLYSFLTSQLNNWMANNVRGVDISFGIDQYDTTSDGAKSTTTSYSYRVSKTLFNDRFKIIVGGNYSTDADADENFSQNLINDISFEYMLNRSGSMYVRLFRHTGYESILEGEVTQTGVGFVYKRKVSSLRDVFKFLIPRRRRQAQAAPQSTDQQPKTEK